MKPDLSIRDVVSSDHQWIHALNESVVPYVNSIPFSDVERLGRMSIYFRAAVLDDAPVGVLIALPPQAAYESGNFRWFVELYPDFVYIDRIVVTSNARRTGAATALYGDLEVFTRERRSPMMVCEVNLRPPNDVSLAVHERLGFRQVGTRENDDGTKTFSMLRKDVPPHEPRSA